MLSLICSVRNRPVLLCRVRTYRLVGHDGVFPSTSDGFSPLWNGTPRKLSSVRQPCSGLSPIMTMSPELSGPASAGRGGTQCGLWRLLISHDPSTLAGMAAAGSRDWFVFY